MFTNQIQIEWVCYNYYISNFCYLSLNLVPFMLYLLANIELKCHVVGLLPSILLVLPNHCKISGLYCILTLSNVRSAIPAVFLLYIYLRKSLRPLYQDSCYHGPEIELTQQSIAAIPKYIDMLDINHQKCKG